MSLKILIAPDKFKGTLTAPQAARAIARGWRAARPRDRLTILPVSDGGDGFGLLLSRQLGAHARQVTNRVGVATCKRRAAHGRSRTALALKSKVVPISIRIRV